MSVTTLVIFVIALLAALFGWQYLFKSAYVRKLEQTWNCLSVRKLKRSAAIKQ